MKVRLLLAGIAAGAVQAPLMAQNAPPADPPPQDSAAPPPATAADAAPQDAQQPTQPDSGDEEPLDDEGQEIVVTGARERGAVTGDIAPEVQLNRRDIRTFGAGSLSELLDALAPQTRSGRGRGEGGPVVLLNGRRISGFSEIRDIPPEAIERVDILPEEVALKYGYRADQRVVNFVLRRRFRAITTEAEAGLATEGGRATYRAEASMLRINQAGRANIAGSFRHNEALFESERDIIQGAPDPTFDLGEFRTLLPATDQLSLNGTINRTILGDVSATANARFEANSSRSFLGRRDAGNSALTRDTDSLSGHVGLAFSGDIAPWRWSATANYDRTGSETFTERNGPTDRAHTLTDSATAQLVASGPLFALPAGNVSTTVRAGFDALGLQSEVFRSGVTQNRDLSRERGSLQANVDIPIASRRRDILQPIGDLSVNLNAELEHFSDFGTLRTLGAGLTWSPIPQLDVIASVTDEDGAPSMQQLGDPVLVTPGVRIFDFVRGETVDIERIDGGNPDLRADNRRVFKLGFTLKPFTKTDLSLTANYTSSRINDPISSFPAATPEIEAAFPDRFFRDPSGRLIRVDNRPVNFARSDRQELRWGINFSRPIGPQPQPGAFRRGGGGGGPGGGPGAGQGGARPGGGQSGAGGRGPGGAGRGGGGFGGGGRGGRLQFAIYHNWRLTDTILIRPGVPELDLLGGSATGSRGGSPRHEIEVQAGLFKNGLGARLSADWQSGTTVRGTSTGLGTTSSTLFFSDFATLNLRLFADLGAQRKLARAHPWLRGMRVSLAVDNLLDNRLNVRDETGATPLSFQPGFIDPLGRSVRISIRKLFF